MKKNFTRLICFTFLFSTFILFMQVKAYAFTGEGQKKIVTIQNENGERMAVEYDSLDSSNSTASAGPQREIDPNNTISFFIEDPNHEQSIIEVNTQNKLYFSNTYMYSYFDLSNSIESVENGWLIKTSGFDWNAAKEYIISVSTSKFITSSTVTQSQLGTTTTLAPDDSYTPLTISVPFTGRGTITIRNLHIIDNNGKVMELGKINSNTLVPPGLYNIQLLAYDDSYAYNLFKINFDISKDHNSLSFTKEDMGIVNINFTNSASSKFSSVYFSPIHQDIHNTYLMGTKWLGKTYNDICVSKLNYKGFSLDFSTNDNWSYYYNIPGMEIGDSLTTINVGSGLTALINLSKPSYNSTDYLPGSELKIQDEYGNQLVRIDNPISKSTVKGILEFKNQDGQTTTMSNLNIGWPFIPLKGFSGTYTLTYKVTEGPLAITPSTATINITETVVSPGISFFISDPNHEQSITLYGFSAISVLYKRFSGSQGQYSYSQPYNVMRNISSTEKGWLISLNGFDWSLSKDFYIFINTSKYLFHAKVIQEQAGSTITLAPDDSYIPVNVSIPFADSSLTIQTIMAGSLDENGVAMYNAKMSPGHLIPSGKYSIQVVGYDNNYGYELFKPGFMISAESNTVEFSRDDVDIIKVSLNDSSNTGTKLDMIAFCPYDWKSGYSSFSASQPDKNYDSFYVSKSEGFTIRYYLKTKEGWYYYFTSPLFEMTNSPTVLNIGTKLSALINLPKTSYMQSEDFEYGAFSISDEYGNMMEIIRNPNFTPAPVPKIFKQNGVVVKTLSTYTTSPLSDLLGEYEISYGANEGPLPVTPATASITVIPTQTELTEVHVKAAFWKRDTNTPSWIRFSKPWKFIIETEEWITGQDYNQLSTFLQKAGGNFILRAADHSDIAAKAIAWFSQVDGSYKGFILDISDSELLKMTPGVEYSIIPQNTSDTYKYTVLDGVTITRPILYGDVTGDDKITSGDYALIKKLLEKKITALPWEYGISMADVDGDGNITLQDCTYIKNYVLGRIKQLPRQLQTAVN